jgi:hypothetical protein
MSSNLDIKRLADVVLDDPKKTSQFVERQFPSHYREEGRELIELVKAYYRFIESETNQSIYNIRRIYQYRDIDTTLESMIVYFKNKFLNGLFFDEDSRFIVKHILDLYRRKGSREGIELFFRLFFEDEIDVYYPAFDMFKPSQSSWREGKYIQLNAVANINAFATAVNRKIYGSISGAEAFVDSVFFINIRNSLIPILFISGTKGVFRDFDIVFSIDPFTEFGSVYGSLNSVNVEQSDTGTFSSNNRVGDRVEIRSPNEGLGAKGRVSKISESFSGEIVFTIDDGGFAYTLENDVSENLVLISEQLIFINNPDREFFLEERIKQINSFGLEVFGIILGQTIDSIGVVLDDTAPDAANTDYFFESGFDIETVDRDDNISKQAFFSTEFNDSSNFEVGDLSNVQTVRIITDIIANVVDVSLGSANFNDSALAPFSGANTVNIDTPLNEAFEPQEFEIGTINKLKSINPGSDYQGDAFILVKETLFSRFNLKNQVINIVPTNVNFLIGDFITQQRTVSTFEGGTEIKTVRGQIVDIIGNNLFVKSLTFEQFVLSEQQIIEDVPTIVSLPIFKEGISIPVTTISISKDFNSLQAGLNASIQGDVSLASGKIQEIEVIDSGFGYNKNERVLIMNTDKTNRILTQIVNSTDENEIDLLNVLLQTIETNGDGFGEAVVNNQGKTEGRWTTFESHINQEKVIQDSFFYQDYSYEISTSIPAEVFEETYKNIVHPAGLKFFSKFAKTETINNDNMITSTRFEDFGGVIDASEFLETAENGFIYLIAEE